MRSVLWSVLLAVIGAVAASQAEDGNRAPDSQPAQRLLGTYRYKYNWIACVVLADTADSVEPTSSVADVPCLRFGEIRLGDSLYVHQKQLGESVNHWMIGDSEDVDVFPLPTPDSVEFSAYVVVNSMHARITALQMAGTASLDTISFAGLRIGDPVDSLKAALGPPFAVDYVEEIDGDMWTYGPFPISIEVLDGRIVSIKIFLTDEYKTALGI